MAWEARLGLKRDTFKAGKSEIYWLNGLGSPFGIETRRPAVRICLIYLRLNGLGSPFGIETMECGYTPFQLWRLNGLGSPFGIET